MGTAFLFQSPDISPIIDICWHDSMIPTMSMIKIGQKLDRTYKATEDEKTVKMIFSHLAKTTQSTSDI